MQKKVHIMCSWCGWENPSRGRSAASRVTAYAARSPRDGFFHPHQEHMTDTYSLYNKFYIRLTRMKVCRILNRNVAIILLMNFKDLTTAGITSIMYNLNSCRRTCENISNDILL